MKAPILINFTILILISLLHFYWSLGGKWASNSVLPVKNNGTQVFKPGAFATLVVAFGMLIFALIILANLEGFNRLIGSLFVRLTTWLIAIIFLGRAFGDFKYVGFTKQIKHTGFARNDSFFYSPLSLLIGIFSLLIAIFNSP